MKKLAVIISVYRNDTFTTFRKCINSLLEQKYDGKIDLWIQFDGNVDPQIEPYLNSINKGNIYINKRDENKGLAHSMNDLLSQVLKLDYEYIARMDADDICMQTRFLKQVTFLDKHPETDIVGGSIEEITEDEITRMIVKYPLEHESMRSFFGRRNPLAHMTVMFRNTYFEKAGIYPTDTDKDEDTIFWLNGFSNGCKFANIPDILVRVRVNDDFYKRRNGFHKSYGDFKNRCRIIRELRLPVINYAFASIRFLIFIIPVAGITHLAYKVFRNQE